MAGLAVALREQQCGPEVVEAMAAGLDIVATTKGAIPGVLDRNGTLLPAGDHVGLARWQPTPTA